MIAGSIAAVISLVLVIVSIRQNTEALQASNESFQYDLQDRWLSDLGQAIPVIANISVLIRKRSAGQRTAP